MLRVGCSAECSIEDELGIGRSFAIVLGYVILWYEIFDTIRVVAN